MGYIKYKTKTISNEFKFLDSHPEIMWNEFKNEKFATNRGLNIFVSVDGNVWQASVEKIPSHRSRDGAGRSIFSVIEAKGTNGDAESKMIYKLISFILQKDNELEHCGNSLDVLFDVSFVNQAFETDKTQEISENIKQFIDKLPETEILRCNGFKSQYVEVASVSKDNINKILKDISQITDKSLKTKGYEIFAVNDLPYNKSDLECVADEIENIEKIDILTKADSYFSVHIDDIKKKVSVLPYRIAMVESRHTSKNGLKPILTIIALLLVSSLIANVLMWINGQSYKDSLAILQKESQFLKNSKDSLIHIIHLNESLTAELTAQIDSLKNPLYIDVVNDNIVKLDISEFYKEGVCKISAFKQGAAFDTIIVRSNVDFIKTKKCYIIIYKNSDKKPFKQIPAVDIKIKKK